MLNFYIIIAFYSSKNGKVKRTGGRKWRMTTCFHHFMWVNSMIFRVQSETPYDMKKHLEYSTEFLKIVQSNLEIVSFWNSYLHSQPKRWSYSCMTVYYINYLEMKLFYWFGFIIHQSVTHCWIIWPIFFCVLLARLLCLFCTVIELQNELWSSSRW